MARPRLRFSARSRPLAAFAVCAAVVAGTAQGAETASSPSTGVVEVDTRLAFNSGSGSGTGMVLTSSGDVLTNNHVIRGATAITVRVPQTGRRYDARVLGYDVADDVALLHLRGAPRLATVTLGTSSSLAVGQRVTAVGTGGGGGSFATNRGKITALGRTITVGDGQGGTARLTGLIRTSADLQSGDSGGPLVDSSRRVVGMNAAASADLVSRSRGSDGYAVPIDRASTIVRQIRSGRQSAAVHIGATPLLGVVVSNTIPRGAPGVVVTGVAAGSPAARIGLRPGALIVGLDGQHVRSHVRLVALLLRKHPGDEIGIAWIDSVGHAHATTVKLAAGPPQ